MTYNGKTNWQVNEIVMPADMNRIEQGIIDAYENIVFNTKYNLVSASKRGIGSTISTVDPIPTTWIMETSGILYNKDGFRIAADSYVGENTAASFAFSISNDTYWQSRSATLGHIQIVLPSALKVTKFRFKTEATAQFSLQIRGSILGDEWTELVSREISAGVQEFEVAIPVQEARKYYQFMFTPTNGVCPKVYAIKIAESSVATQSIAYTLASAPTSWEQNQYILIQTPMDVNSAGVLLNTFNSVPIRTILQTGKKYRLVYNNGQFDATEVD